MFVLRSIDSPVSTAPNFIDSFAHNCTFLEKLFFIKDMCPNRSPVLSDNLGEKLSDVHYVDF